MASCPQFETQGFQWKLRRLVDNTIDFAGSGTTKPYPETTCALQSLRAALLAEMPLKRHRRTSKLATPTRKRKSPGMPPAIPQQASRKHYLMKWRLQKTIEALRAQLASQTGEAAWNKMQHHLP